ncbi:MAG TPA: hypothetical protein VGI22_08525, partial [Xanthobacteraceae bacterium]
MSPPNDLDRLSHAELKGLVVKHWGQMVELQLNGGGAARGSCAAQGRASSTEPQAERMERGTEPKPPGSSGDRKRPRGSTRSKLSIHEERTVEVAAPPRGSRFKGYTSFVVQDLVIR